MFSRQTDLELVWKFKKVTKVNTEQFQEFYVKNIPVKLQYNVGKFWGVVMFTRQLDLGATRKVQKGCTKINIKLGRNSDVNKIPVKLQHGTCNCWGVISFTRSFDLGLEELLHATIWTWPSSKISVKGCEGYLCKVTTWCIQFLRSYRVHNTRQQDLEQVWKFKKVTQRSISNSFDMLM